MKYLRIKPEYDNCTIHIKKNKCGLVIGNELITMSECQRDYENKIPSCMYDLVDINKNKIYWSFGARFSD